MSKRIPPLKPSRSGGFIRKGSRETILLVEDEAPFRDLLARILGEAGYRVLTAADGEEALSMSEDYRGVIHLLLTDVMMPVMNGKDLADRLCVLRPDIKVLFISGFRRTDVFPSDTCEETVDWLPKPFTADRLNRKVREILDSVSKA